MAAVVGSLLVELTASNDNLSKALTAAGHDLSKLETKTTRSLSRMDQAYSSRFSAMAKSATALSSTMLASFGGLAGGMIGGLAAGGILQGVKATADSIVEVGRAAQIAGVDFESFQELKYLAEQSFIPIDALQDGLKEMSLRTDEFVASAGKSGSAVQAFQRLGYTADELKQKIKQPSALFLELIDRMRQFDAAAQIRLSDEIFGGQGGEEFVQLLGRSQQELERTVQSARDLGVVMDTEILAKAQEVDRQFNALASTVGTVLKSAIVSAAQSLGQFIDGYRSLQNQRLSTLQAGQADTDMKRLDLENRILETKNNQNLSDRARTKALATYNAQLAQLTDHSAAIADAQSKLLPPLTVSTETWTPPAAPAVPATGQRSGGGQSSAATREQTDAAAELITKLEQELQALTMTGQQQAIFNNLNSAGAEATDAQREQISALTLQLYAQQEALSLAKDVTKGALGDIRSALSDGKITWQEWGDIALNILDKIIGKLEDQLVDALFSAEGILGGSGKSTGGGFLGAIGSLFGFASGGYTGDGGKYEPKGVVHGGEFVFDKESTAAAGTETLYGLMNYLKTGDASGLLNTLDGYSDGGFVGSSGRMSVPSARSTMAGFSSSVEDMGESVRSSTGSSEPGTIAINVSGARGNAEIADMVQQGVTAGLKAYNKQLPYRIKQINANPTKI